MADAMLTTRQVADRLGLATHTVSDRAAAGDIPGASKIFGRWRFDPDTFEGWIASQATRDPWAAPSRGRRSA